MLIVILFVLILLIAITVVSPSKISTLLYELPLMTELVIVSMRVRGYILVFMIIVSDISAIVVGVRSLVILHACIHIYITNLR